MRFSVLETEQVKRNGCRPGGPAHIPHGMERILLTGLALQVYELLVQQDVPVAEELGHHPGIPAGGSDLHHYVIAFRHEEKRLDLVVKGLVGLRQLIEIHHILLGDGLALR